MKEISAVTALYDIGRARIDGRTATDYIEWLNATLRLPIRFTIFLDPKIDSARVMSKPEDVLIRAPKDIFKPFSWRSQIESICRSSRKIRTRRDIAFLLPEYGMIVNSKLYMLAEAKKYAESETLIWLDAGISRFFDQDLATSKIDRAFADRLAKTPLALTADWKLVLDKLLHRSGKKYVGTCTRLMAGTDIAVAASRVDQIINDATHVVETEWLPNDLWDNDQVLLGRLVLAGQPVTIVNVSKQFACVAERLFSFPTRAKRPHSSIAQRLRWHFGPRASILTSTDANE